MIVSAVAGCTFGLSAIAATADPKDITLELNKLEASEKGCQASLVVGNSADTAYQSLKLDFVVFQPDGVVGKWVRLNLAPVHANKRSVKSFVIEGTACDKVGSLLVNDVVECASTEGPLNDCLARLKVSSLSPVQLTK